MKVSILTCLLAASWAAQAEDSPSGYLDSAFGWQPYRMQGKDVPSGMRSLDPERQHSTRFPGVPTGQLILEQARRHDAAVLRADGAGWLFFPSSPPAFMPYLDSLFVPGNTCVEPGALMEDGGISALAQRIKSAASELGLQYTLLLTADYTHVAPRPGSQRRDFMAFNNALTGTWFLAKSRDNERGFFLSFEADWGEGGNFNQRRSSAQGSIGSLSNPQGSNRGGNGVFVPNLALGYSHWGGRLVSMAGTIDMSNFLDQNAYSGSWSGNLMNESFNFNPCLPLQWANPGFLTAFQPSRNWYLLYAGTACNTKINHNPFSDLSWNSWIHVAELGFIREDVAGLGPGTYRLQLTATRNGGQTGMGAAFNLQQQLGRQSRLGFFSRCGVMDEDAAAITGVKAAATAGLVLQAPFSSSGWGSAANNDQVALGFLWQRAAHADSPVAHRDEYGLEMSAVVQVTPTFFLQPDVQCIVNPVHETDEDCALIFQLQGVFRF